MEAPELWPGVHGSLIVAIRDVINSSAPQRYFADVEERVFVCEPDDPYYRVIIPDVAVADTKMNAADHRGGSSATAMLSPSVQCRLLDEEMRERYVAVRTTTSDGSSNVVTVIEVLSPANKLRNSAARKSYLAKRRAVMNSSTHFIEIDLLRAGDRTPMSEIVPAADYLVTVSRAEERPTVSVFPAHLTKPLPTFPVPLLPGDDDVVLNLQEILQTVHDRSGYERRLNYSEPVPGPELPEERLTWIRQLTSDTQASSPT